MREKWQDGGQYAFSLSWKIKPYFLDRQIIKRIHLLHSSEIGHVQSPVSKSYTRSNVLGDLKENLVRRTVCSFDPCLVPYFCDMKDKMFLNLAATLHNEVISGTVNTKDQRSLGFC